MHIITLIGGITVVGILRCRKSHGSRNQRLWSKCLES